VIEIMSFMETTVESSRREPESSRRIETPRDMRFRYGYICRLIDDGELQTLPAPLRTRTRSFHKAAYWKSLSLMRRDADFVLKTRRERMASLQQWDFQALLNDYARVQVLLAKLTVAGMSHSIHLGAGLESARQACREVEVFLASASALVNASSPLAMTA
jgi:hypothetical protein